MRRKPGALIPIEVSILDAGLDLERRGIEDFHGYLLAAKIADREGARRLLAHGSLYRALGRMERDGLLDSRWEDADLAAALPVDRELVVLTNGLPIAMALSVRPNITVLMIGGKVRSRTQAAVDAWALQALADSYVDVAFIGTNGISPERGLTTPDTTESAVKRAMIRAARRSVVLADHTKVGQDHLSRFATLDEIDTLITDSGLDPQVADELRALGPKVLLA